MKRIQQTLVLMFVLAIAQSGVGSITDTTIESNITEVTVYPDLAKIKRSAVVNLPAGENRLTLEKIPSSALKESFRATALGPSGAKLMGLKHEVRFLNHPANPQAAELQKRLDNLVRQDADSISDRLEVFKQVEKSLSALIENASGEMIKQFPEGNLNVLDWEKALDFARTKLIKTHDTIRYLEREISEKSARIEQLRSQLSHMRSARSKQVNVVSVDLDLPTAGEVELSLEYLISGANWTPSYDVRFAEDSDTLVLSYFAEVTQGTGEDWGDVTLTLSTASPLSTMGPGEYSPDYLSVVGGDLHVRGGRAGESRNLLLKELERAPSQTADEMAPAIPVTSSVAQSPFATTFSVARPESIRSGGAATRALIGEWPLSMEKQLLARPKTMQSVFRIARLDNTLDAPLLPGRMNLFVNTEYIGAHSLTSFITPGQKWELPFGSDNRLPIKREVLTSNEDHKSSKSKISRTIQITLSNHSGSEQTIRLEEPLPVSQDTRIVVRPGSIEPETGLTDERGLHVWEINLAAGEKIVAKIPYRVEYPKGLAVAGL